MIYREQSNETNTETYKIWPSTDVSPVIVIHTEKALFSNIIYQFLYNHVATAVKVSQGSYVARSSKLVKWEQAHVVTEPDLCNICLGFIT